MASHTQGAQAYQPFSMTSKERQVSESVHACLSDPNMPEAEYKRRINQAYQGSNIVYVGDGTITAGQSSEYYVPPRLSLCYQCCLGCPLNTIFYSRDESCGESSCSRTTEARVAFTPMPAAASAACDEFQTFMNAYIDQLECKAIESMLNRARDRVMEARYDVQRITIPYQHQNPNQNQSQN